jgi:hypothetical protein
MRIAEENWKVLASLFPAGWQQMAWQSGAVEADFYAESWAHPRR